MTSLRISGETYARLRTHLFPGDGDEHGGVLLTGLTATARGTRLLARAFVPALDGVDYVPGRRGYRVLRPEFVRDLILRARDERLVYLAVHNHGGVGSVSFSDTDLDSHERGYPALLDIARGLPVGALVLADGAVAGDIWWPAGARTELADTTVVGPVITHVSSDHMLTTKRGGAMFERQSLLFGAAGQATLAKTRVAIVGTGGAGMLLVEYLARLGVGQLVLIDPDRVDLTNLPRLSGARRRDAGLFLDGRWPSWLNRLGSRFAAPKVNIAARLAREAYPPITLETRMASVLEPDVARRLVDCDFIMLAADTAQARLLVNAVAHQYLVPVIQVGAKVRVDPATGRLIDVHAVARPIWPDSGCLWCNGLISPRRLAEESLSPEEARGQRYVEDVDVIAPSVITLNAIVAAQAANDFLFAITGMRRASASLDYLRFRPLDRSIRFDRPRRDPQCPECGPGVASRFARGDRVDLPTRAA